MARYELIQGTSRKFWEVAVTGTRLVVRWGRTGTEGRSKTFDLPTAAAAREKRAKLVAEKVAKGYRAVKSATAAGNKPKRAGGKSTAASSGKRVAKPAVAGRASPASPA